MGALAVSGFWWKGWSVALLVIGLSVGGSVTAASGAPPAGHYGGTAHQASHGKHGRHKRTKNATQPQRSARQPSPCIAAFPDARAKTIGKTTWYNRQESVRMVVCYGFGLTASADFPVSADMVCGLVAQAIGAPAETLGLFADGVCSGAELATEPNEPTKYIGLACQWASDILGVLAKPAGVIASLGCTLAPSVGHALGSALESKHEFDVAKDVMQHGKCIKYSPTHFGSAWLAISCSASDPGFTDLPKATPTSGLSTTGSGGTGAGTGSGTGPSGNGGGAPPGAGWTLQPLPGTSNSSGLTAVYCTSSTWCLATGIQESNVFQGIWNGGSWAVQPIQGITGSLDSISCISLSWCMAMGSQTAALWNGSSWQPTVLPGVSGAESVSYLSDSCTSQDFCLAAGQANFSDGSFTPVTAKWDGSNWSPITTSGPTGSLNTDLVSVSCPAENNCTAVGGYDNDEGIFTGEAYAEHWNGSGWTVETTPNPGGGVYSGLNSVSCPAVGSCVAVGYWDRGLGTFPVPLAEELRNGSWSSTGAVLPTGAESGETAYVSCAPSSSACEAVGQSYTGEHETGLAEGWNGGSWNVQSTPTPPGGQNWSFADISCSGSTACLAVGGTQILEGSQIIGGTAFAESYSG